MKTSTIRLVLILLAIVWLAGTSLFTVDATEYAIVKRFGDPVATHRAGLHVKWPAPIDTIQKVDNRLFKLMTPTDETNMETLTADQYSVLYSVYAVWRVASPDVNGPVVFTQRVVNREGAEARMEETINAQVKAAINDAPFSQLISTDASLVNQDGVLRQARETCMAEFRDKYGVELVDLRFRRLFFPDKNREDVFDSIRADRQKIAREIRALGQREANEILAEARRVEAETLADARRKAEILRGRGNAEATEIWNRVVKAHPRFSEFWLKMQALDKSLDSRTTLILPGDLGLTDAFWEPPEGRVEIQP